MNTTNVTPQKKRSNGLELAVSLAITCAMLCAGSANATGIPVVDGAHLGINQVAWGSNYGQLATQYSKQLQQYQKQLQQYLTQINQYKTQIDQYKQMYVKGISYKPAPSYRENIDERFPERDVNEGVAENCGEKAANNPVGPEQRRYCIAIIQTQNRRYNAVRELLNDVKENDKDLADARAEREKIPLENLGELEANTNRITSIQSKMQNDIQNAKYLMDAYEAALATLKNDMVRKADLALFKKNQSNSGWQDAVAPLVQAKVLDKVLDAAHDRRARRAGQ